MRNRDRNKKVTPGTIIAIVIALALAAPELFAVVLTIAIFAAILGSPFVIYYLVKKKNGSGKQRPQKRSVTGQQAFPLDDCPKPVCFHKDKGEHHVRKGKEIDPWDRPDIDISKYQRRQ